MKTSLLTALLLSGGLLLASAANASPELAKKYNCFACHSMDKKVVGPAFKDIGSKYKGQNMQAKLEEKVKKGGAGSFGPIPMSPNPQVPDADIKLLVKWVLAQ
ncbi:c-type cytochrome [Vogesella indigofera]|uniref:c-type cytochrome n=1 Tax=Vogesella indigofera TaxID=45465 RepID=UPI00234E7A78|nr:c-type cytochrome [Vogesella indigofera]MDC7701564.1 c-type cytochrome [Vogesella indigofera]